jgi:hypothetical protein
LTDHHRNYPMILVDLAAIGSKKLVREWDEQDAAAN